MGRVVAEELPTLWGGLVDLDPDLPAQDLTDLLAAEITQPDAERQLAYRAGQRYAVRLVCQAHAARRMAQEAAGGQRAGNRPLHWRADASYLITGGLGDLGLRVAGWMVDQGARQLVLVGRRGLPPRAHWGQVGRDDPRQAARIAAIGQLEEAGARVLVGQCDVAEQHQLKELLTQLEQQGWPPLRGVVHAAGVVEACQLVDLQPDALRAVLRPKVSGSWNLHQALAQERLDFFVNFSSGAALLGSPMLASYAAANAFLDAMAHHRRAAGQAGLSINWGFWDEIGMVARSQRDRGRGFAPQGMFSFTPRQGLAALRQFMEQQAVQMAVLPTDWSVWRRAHPHAARASLFADLLPPESDPEARLTDAAGGPEVTREAILAADPERQHEMFTRLLTDQLAVVLRTGADQIDPHEPLNHLGIDSLMAVELRNHIQARLDVVIPVAELLQNPTITQLATTLREQLSGPEDAVPVVPIDPDAVHSGSNGQPTIEADSPTTRATTEQNLANLDNLSDAQVDALLAQLQKNSSSKNGR